MSQATNTEITEKSISERFSEVWRELSHNQRRFVVAMRQCSTKAEGAKLIQLEPDTVYRWPALVDEAIDLMDDSIKDASVEILSFAAAKAAMLKVGGMDSDDEKVRQDSASEILDRVLGRPQQAIKHEGTGEGGAIIVEQRYTVEERIRGLGALFDAVRTGVLAGDYGGDDALDADERPAMAGVSESGG